MNATKNFIRQNVIIHEYKNLQFKKQNQYFSGLIVTTIPSDWLVQIPKKKNSTPTSIGTRNL